MHVVLKHDTHMKHTQYHTPHVEFEDLLLSCSNTSEEEIIISLVNVHHLITYINLCHTYGLA